jgi:hypothetical protein
MLEHKFELIMPFYVWVLGKKSGMHKQCGLCLVEEATLFQREELRLKFRLKNKILWCLHINITLEGVGLKPNFFNKISCTSIVDQENVVKREDSTPLNSQGGRQLESS